MSKSKIAGIAIGVVLLAGVLGWMFTAPYLSNQGLGRTPGIILEGHLQLPLLTSHRSMTFRVRLR